MKKSAGFSLFLLFVLMNFKLSNAQITIGSGDMPGAGDVITISNGQAFTGMNARLTGANYTWDFSQLVASTQTVDTFVSVLSTGFYAFSFFSNSSFALKSNAVPVNIFGFLSIEYEYDFYKKSTAAYVQTGFGAKMNGFPLPVPFDPKDTIYRFPLHYNDIGSSLSAFQISIPGLGFYGGEKTRIDTVDGWGTLTTPYGTFPVLRVKSVILETDSLYSDTLNYGISFPRPAVTEYKWLGQNQRIPLLQINTSNNVITQILYRDSVRSNPLSIASSENHDFHFTLYPNPTTSKLIVEYELKKETDVSLDIFNATGEKVITRINRNKPAGRQFFTLDLEKENLPAGIYLTRINLDGKKSLYQRFIKLVD